MLGQARAFRTRSAPTALVSIILARATPAHDDEGSLESTASLGARTDSSRHMFRARRSERAGLTRTAAAEDTDRDEAEEDLRGLQHSDAQQLRRVAIEPGRAQPPSLIARRGRRGAWLTA